MHSPHNTVCPGCHSCQPERFPNTSGGASESRVFGYPGPTILTAVVPLGCWCGASDNVCGNPSKCGPDPQAAPGSFAEYLETAGFPYLKLTDSNVRHALDAAIGTLEDAGLRADFAVRAEEEINEALGQAMEP